MFSLNGVILLVIAADLLIVFYLLKRNYDLKFTLEYKTGEIQEKLNLSQDENLKELKNNSYLQSKIIRYNSLKKIVEEINQNLDLDSVAGHLAEVSFSLIANNKGDCLLYLVDRKTQRLHLFQSRKEPGNLPLRAKQGDVFDLWVLRHSQSLLVEDAKKDFRFDLEKSSLQDARPICSLISSGLVSEDRFLGILRLDHPEPGFYSQDDLRFLARICDLGAVALENSLLFKETQELAIHDELTGLFTKGYFLDRLGEECARSLRQGSGFSLLLLDIDLFKNYNDKFGHIAGDIVLRKLSQNLKAFLHGSNPILSRFGGEEFCVILPAADKKKALQIATQLRKQIEKEKIILRRQETGITVSIGVAGFPADANEAGELIRLADSAMYRAKEKGRNQVCST